MRDLSKQTLDHQITTAACGHILTNANVWSPDGKWIVYDMRSDAAGAVFDGRSIEAVEVATGRVIVLFDAGPSGVASFDPNLPRVVFIRGPVHPTSDWSYSATHREGVLVDLDRPGIATVLDGRDLIPPFTPGALRGGSHVHIFSPDSKLVSFTYEDAVLEKLEAASSDHDRNARAVGVTVMDRAVYVPAGPHNEDGAGFSVLVTALVDEPAAGSDQISRAFEESWIGTAGYTRPDGARQRHALAFQGRVHGGVDEVFVADLPDDLTIAGEGPLQGTQTRRPAPPAGTRQHRLTFTAGRKHPGIQGPRHWLRSSPDGSAIGFLMRDDAGVAQFCAISPNGGPIRQITRGPFGVDSAFTWHPDGSRVAAVMDGSVVTIDVQSGEIERLTRRATGDDAPRLEACVFSPGGSAISYVRRVRGDGGVYNQIFVVEMPIT